MVKRVQLVLLESLRYQFISLIKLNRHKRNLSRRVADMTRKELHPDNVQPKPLDAPTAVFPLTRIHEKVTI